MFVDRCLSVLDFNGCFFLVCEVIMGLKEKFREATMRNDVKAIVLTGENYGVLAV